VSVNFRPLLKGRYGRSCHDQGASRLWINGCLKGSNKLLLLFTDDDG
jgi:hypothetical protein